MKILKAILAVSFTGFFCNTASADWNFGVSYMNFSDNSSTPTAEVVEQNDEFSVKAMALSVGYLYSIGNSDFSVMPEARYGYGFGDDTITVDDQKVVVEADHFAAFSLRGIYQLSKNFVLFAQPSYGNLKLKASTDDSRFSQDEWQFGMGAGLSYSSTRSVAFEVMYEKFDDIDIMSAGVRFRF
ncbi:outer membrane beta-barrel protein [Alteromonas pelagimontana]|uniref:Outer membrane beta-barrel protein n=1 Tax=Alteromonas pelagimontana TaxID=1858656 RepID=A0A6M4MEN6_9ALTE|nr:outer membrane beta-barrel protein [Alteromonas pelagimontana]QJR81338.1 outer membrane beta-barrel protein [Alteromonas pelagimontana]